MIDKTLAHAFPSDRLQATAANTPRRTTHGSCAWSLPSRFQSLRQPQDGAIANAAHSIPSILAAQVRTIDSRVSTVDAEDARLNGSLRSLARRVKGLNVMQSRPVDASLTQPERYYAEPVGRKTQETGRKGMVPMAVRPQVA